MSKIEKIVPINLSEEPRAAFDTVVAAQAAAAARESARKKLHTLYPVRMLAQILAWWALILLVRWHGPDSLSEFSEFLLIYGRFVASLTFIILAAFVVIPEKFRYTGTWRGASPPEPNFLAGNGLAKLVLSIAGLAAAPLAYTLELLRHVATSHEDLPIGKPGVPASKILEDDRVKHLIAPLLRRIDAWNGTTVVLNRIVAMERTDVRGLSEKVRTTIQDHERVKKEIIRALWLVLDLLSEGPLGSAPVALASDTEDPLPSFGNRMSMAQEPFEELSNPARRIVASREVLAALRPQAS